MYSDSNKNQLIECIKTLSSEAIHMLLTLALRMIDVENITITICPYCGSEEIVRNGKKCGKQRFLCKSCKRTFVTTTHTILSMSHSPASIWREVVSDTLQGHAIDYTAERLGLSHPCIFGMRHKFLLALQDLIAADPVLLNQVAELDETFVLDCFKGKELSSEINRPARKHGAKAQKRGISNEYICINTGVQRNGGVVAEATNRAKPDKSELTQVYEGHLQDGCLVLCDGLKSYNVLKEIAQCSIQDIATVSKEEENFYHLNTVNNFHSFIKDRYDFYRGVATKYLNRYVTLFTLAWQQSGTILADLCSKLFTPSTTNYFYGNQGVKTERLLIV